jgi:hypothetical protein
MEQRSAQGRRAALYVSGATNGSLSHLLSVCWSAVAGARVPAHACMFKSLYIARFGV